MISDLKINAFETSEFWCIVCQLFYVYYKAKTPIFFHLKFLLLLRKRWLSPESCLAICHSGLVVYKPVACQKISVLKMFQHSIFQRNTVLLEIIQSKQKPSTTEFLLPRY